MSEQFSRGASVPVPQSKHMEGGVELLTPAPRPSDVGSTVGFLNPAVESDVEATDSEGTSRRAPRPSIGIKERLRQGSRFWLYDRLRFLHPLKLVHEMSGALGDLGTLLPLLLALVEAEKVSLVPAMFWGGVFNITVGLWWNLPWPVQPMKSIAAVALVEDLSREEVFTAGLSIGIMVLCLGIGVGKYSGIALINRLIPRGVVNGIQLGLGMSMAIRGATMAKSSGTWRGIDSLSTALLAFLFLTVLLSQQHRWHIPAALIIFGVGVILAGIQMATDGTSLEFGVSSPFIWVPNEIAWSDWQGGILRGALPQLPLTTLNSVVSVCTLSRELFPDRSSPSHSSVSVSVGMMNALGCLFGAMPMCHGAGGLAGQYAFGARSGISVILLGTSKIFLALVLGASFLSLLDAFPSAILGVMLAYAGMELALVGCRNGADRIAITTAAVQLGLKSTWMGAVAGIFTAAVLRILGTNKDRAVKQKNQNTNHSSKDSTQDSGNSQEASTPPACGC